MKLLKTILIAILVIIAIPLILALFVKKDYALEREIVIDQPKEVVFDYIKYLKNQDKFSTWANIDPQIKQSYQGTDGTVGFISRWESDHKQVGSGEQEITAIVEGERIDFELRFIEPFASIAPAYMTTETVSDQKTKVRWGFKGHMSYPMNLFLLFVDMESMLGSDFEKGLLTLKNTLESQPQSTPTGTKAYLMDYYKAISDTLTMSVKELSQNQLNYKPSLDRWSIAQCLDHIVKSEKLLLNLITEEMQKTAQPQLLDSVRVSDEKILAQLADRAQKYTAPKEYEGSSTYTDVDVFLKDYKEAEAPILQFVDSTALKDMRSHYSTYPFGNSDVYQAVMAIAGHTNRHIKQIEEVKSDAGFPKQ